MRKALTAAGVVAASLAVAIAAGAATNATTKLEAKLRGANEGAPASNRGKTEIRLTPSTGKVCWETTITKIDGKPNASHIHKGRQGVSGNVVVPLGAGYKRQGCTTASKASAESPSCRGSTPAPLRWRRGGWLPAWSSRWSRRRRRSRRRAMLLQPLRR